jgi:3-hydroxyacyl-[acyl-carrier-protein] dehydratase
MRWMWVDRFTEFVSGSHAAGIKNVSLVEEVIDEYCPSYPMLPPTLIIEGMAQLGGILVAEHFGFDKRVVLAKVGRATYHSPARPGDQLLYRVSIDSVGPSGATVTSTSHCEGQLQAEIELMFAFLEGDEFPEQSLFLPGDLLAMLQAMRLFEIAVDKDGKPLNFPLEKL